MFVVVNGEGSPFAGLIPAGEAALETARQADRNVSLLRQRIDELQGAQPAAPEEVAHAAVTAAIAELEARGVFNSPAPPEVAKPARKQAAQPKGA
jgi:hypothetical protein